MESSGSWRISHQAIVLIDSVYVGTKWSSRTYITPDTDNAKVISMGFFIQVSFYTLCWYILFTKVVFAYLKHHHFRTEGNIFIYFAYADDISLMRLDCWFTNSDANIKWSSVDLQILISICYDYSCAPVETIGLPSLLYNLNIFTIKPGEQKYVGSVQASINNIIVGFPQRSGGSGLLEAIHVGDVKSSVIRNTLFSWWQFFMSIAKSGH